MRRVVKKKKGDSAVSGAKEEKTKHSMRHDILLCIITTVISVTLSGVLGKLIDSLMPIDSRIDSCIDSRIEKIDSRIEKEIEYLGVAVEQQKASIEHLSITEEKDLGFIELAKRLTGQADEKTVEMVKGRVIDYLSMALKDYPTWDDFKREKGRYVDKKTGVVWEVVFDNGGVYNRPVGLHTNVSERVMIEK